MAFYRNKSGQAVPVYAVDGDGAPATGDAANITAQISKDKGASAATNDANPTELDATDHPGIYLFDLTQSESDADLIILSPASSTSGVLIDPVILFTEPETRSADVVSQAGRPIARTLAAGGTTSITLADDDGAGIGDRVYTVDGLGAGQDLLITGKAGQVATVEDFRTGAEPSAMDGTTTYYTLPPAHAPRVESRLGTPSGDSIAADLAAMRGATFEEGTDSLEALRDRGDAAWGTATGFSTFDAATDPVTLAADQSAVTALGGLDVTGAAVDANLVAVDESLAVESTGLATSGQADAIKATTDKLDTALESDGGSGYQLTTLALENAPVGAGGGLDAAGVRSAIGLASANLDAQLAGLSTFDAGTTPVLLGTDQSAVLSLGGLDVSGASIDANIVAVDAGLTAGATDVADAVADTFGVRGTVDDSGPTSGGFDGDAALSSADGFYVGSVLAFRGGTLDGQARKVTGYTGASRSFAFATAFSAAPTNGDAFVVLGRIEG